MCGLHWHLETVGEKKNKTLSDSWPCCASSGPHKNMYVLAYKQMHASLISPVEEKKKEIKKGV